MRPGEGRSAFLFFLHGFLLLSSYQVVKALREAFMLTRFSAEVRAYAVAVMALVLMVVVPLYGHVRRHLDGARLLRAVTLFFVATHAAVRGACAWAGVPIAFMFFIWVGIYGVMVVSQMWAFAADTFNLKSGQRLFPVIMLGPTSARSRAPSLRSSPQRRCRRRADGASPPARWARRCSWPGRNVSACPEGSRAIAGEHGKPVPRLLGASASCFGTATCC